MINPTSAICAHLIRLQHGRGKMEFLPDKIFEYSMFLVPG